MRPCRHCAQPLHPAKRADALYCSPDCRKRAFDQRRAIEIFEAYENQRDLLENPELRGVARLRQESRVRDLMLQLFRFRYALTVGDSEVPMVGLCGRCGTPLYRVGQQFCSSRCRVAAHRALKRSVARRQSGRR